MGLLGSPAERSCPRRHVLLLRGRPQACSSLQTPKWRKHRVGPCGKAPGPRDVAVPSGRVAPPPHQVSRLEVPLTDLREPGSSPPGWRGAQPCARRRCSAGYGRDRGRGAVGHDRGLPRSSPSSLPAPLVAPRSAQRPPGTGAQEMTGGSFFRGHARAGRCGCARGCPRCLPLCCCPTPPLLRTPSPLPFSGQPRVFRPSLSASEAPPRHGRACPVVSLGESRSVLVEREAPLV